MIAIVNKGPHVPEDPMGWRDYEVRINQDLITRFKHRRGDGLAVCLLKASEAVKQQREEEVAKRLIDLAREEGKSGDAPL